jgi:transposase
VRELERLLGRKTMENEILREALAKAQAKKQTLRPLSLPRDGSR